MKKTNFIYKLFLLTMVFGASCFFNAGNAFAQSTEINLTVSPPITYIHVAPGTTKNHTIILENHGRTALTVLPTIVDFTTNGKTGQAIISDQLSFPYISFGENGEETEITIPAQQKKEFILNIDVPGDAPEKEHPLTVLFFSKNASGPIRANTPSSQVSAAIGSNLIILTSKNTVFDKFFEILDFNAPTVIDSFQSIQFTPLVQNNSVGATVASGSAKIVNWRKQTIAEFDIYPDIILGNNSRELRALLSDSNPDEPEVSSFIYKPKFLLGPYQIVVSLYNEQNQQIIQEIHVFYAFPIAVFIAITTGILITIYFAKTKSKISNI